MSTPSVPYDFLDQNIVSSCLVQQTTIDSFFSPVLLEHTGFAYDGKHYTSGVVDMAGSPPALIYASWFTENISGVATKFRGAFQPFPTAGLVLLSSAALSIFNAATSPLTLWMGFLFADGYALGNNYDPIETIGFNPSNVQYANGTITVTLKPDAGSSSQSIVAVNIDFSADSIYLDTTI